MKLKYNGTINVIYNHFSMERELSLSRSSYRNLLDVVNVTISFTMNQETSTGTIPRTTKRDIFLKESLVSAIKGRKK